MSIRFLANFLKQNKLEIDDKHWEVEDPSQEIKQRLFFLNDEPPALKFHLRKKKSCFKKNCVHPDCHFLVITKTVRNPSKQDFYEDIESLMDEINLARVQEVGMEEYLLIFNANQPDFLKIDLATLKKVVYLKGKQNENKG